MLKHKRQPMGDKVEAVELKKIIQKKTGGRENV